jgi:quercetin dioxygenase-like cupin family protein
MEKMIASPRKRKGFSLPLALTFAVVGLFLLPSTAGATPPRGATETALGGGNLQESIHMTWQEGDRGEGVGVLATHIFMSRIQVEQGGEMGWHQHGGPVWVVVTSGVLHYYSGEDPECRARVYTKGEAFMDPGNVTHNARNEGGEPLEVYATYFLPDGGRSRIDRDDPGNCNFR